MRDFDPLPLSCSSQDHIIGGTTIKAYALETSHFKIEKHRWITYAKYAKILQTADPSIEGRQNTISYTPLSKK